MTQKPFDLVVFDWEGTLGDPLGHVVEAVRKQADLMGLKDINLRELRIHLPLGLEYTISKAFPALPLSQSEIFVQTIHQILLENHSAPSLFCGAKRLLTALKKADITLAIATNKGQHSLAKVLQQTELETFFTVTRSAGQVPAKPCPQMLDEIMSVCGVLSTRTLMIGDSVSDIEMSIAAGVLPVGIDFYYQQSEELLAAGAVHVFHDYAAVGHYLGLPGY